MATTEGPSRDQPPTATRVDGFPRALLLAFAVLFFYLAGGFLLDDYFHLERASRPFGAEALRFAIHTEDYGIVLWPRSEPVHLEFLRPLTSLSLWLEFRLWGLHAWGYHADNLLLHFLNAALLFLLARRLRLTRAASGVVAVAWGVALPAAPAVGWISGRTEVLYSFFALASVLAIDRWTAGGRSAWFAGGLLFAALAPLAKESGVVAPVLILIVARLREIRVPGSARRRLTPALAAVLFLPAAAYLVARFGILHTPPPPPPYSQPFGGSAADVVWLLAQPALYLVSALLSLPLSHVSPLVALRESPLLLAVPCALGVALMTAPLRAVGWATATWLLLWFGAGLLPYLPVIPTSLYLYLPLAGLLLLLGIASDARPNSRWPSRWLAGLVAAGVLAQLTISVFTMAAARSLAEAASTAASASRRDGVTRLVLFDTPVWAYGISAAMRLREPERRLDTWLVNFSPSVRPGEPSRLEWRSPLLLEARPARGRYFDSPFERFLLFGSSPTDTALHVRSDALAVQPDSLVEHPRAILARFRDEPALAATEILQFRGWRLVPAPRRPATVPLPTGAEAEAPASSALPGPFDTAGPATAR